MVMCPAQLDIQYLKNNPTKTKPILWIHRHVCAAWKRAKHLL